MKAEAINLLKQRDEEEKKMKRRSSVKK